MPASPWWGRCHSRHWACRQTKPVSTTTCLGAKPNPCFPPSLVKGVEGRTHKASGNQGRGKGGNGGERGGGWCLWGWRGKSAKQTILKCEMCESSSSGQVVASRWLFNGHLDLGVTQYKYRSSPSVDSKGWQGLSAAVEGKKYLEWNYFLQIYFLCKCLESGGTICPP